MLIVGGVALAGMYERVLEWEHRWMVAQCPIAYVGEDGRIHLTNEAGTLDVELEASVASIDDEHRGLFYPQPEWSPSGQLIAYMLVGQRVETRSGQTWFLFERALVVLEPAARRMWRPVESANADFGGWVRDEILILNHQFIDARTGEFVPRPQWADMHSISPVPLRGGGGWIAVGSPGLHFRTDDFRMRMPIWSSYGSAAGPRVDPSGAWAGWTSHAGASAGIQIKLIEETVAKPPRTLWPGIRGSVFCDWTRAGNVFANVSERGTWGLVILDKQGTVLRRIATDVRPMAGSGASWRRWASGEQP